MLSRNTYLEIDLDKIKSNVEKITKKLNTYEYYIGVVKADCYGLSSLKTVKAIIEGGCNYLAVATYEEAMYIRNAITNIPILCLGLIPKEYIEDSIRNNITITISKKEYLDEIKDLLNENAKVHIKLNTGMNRLGIDNKIELEEVYKILKNKNVNIEGIYSHIYDACSQEVYSKQLKKFHELIEVINMQAIKICHIAASEAVVTYQKPDYVNGCRVGIVIYGFTNDENLDLESSFCLKSEVIQINELEEGESVGYGGVYTADEKTKIAVVPIGYADGIIRKNTGRYVFINDKRYPIVGSICMDMLFVKVDDSVKFHDTVEVLRDVNHIKEVAKHLDTISYEVMCSIGKRVPRIYK